MSVKENCHENTQYLNTTLYLQSWAGRAWITHTQNHITKKKNKHPKANIWWQYAEQVKDSVDAVDSSVEKSGFYTQLSAPFA